MTIPMFHCIFNGHESITSFIHDFDEKLYKSLPNLYAICISNNRGSTKNIVAGFFVKTSYTHEDSEFLDAITAVTKSNKELAKTVGDNASFFTDRLTISGSKPLFDNEMLQVISQQALKFSVGGNAKYQKIALLLLCLSLSIE
ncbi:MAG: hypothetical protein QNL62_04265 [Gammaproteobacteria bacterium]|nr:hypothetical protein [Gammaproteobacteria bacterium]